MVSDAFAESGLRFSRDFDRDRATCAAAGTSGQSLESEVDRNHESGTSRPSQSGSQRDLGAYVRIDSAEGAVSRLLQLGFSDRVRVYLNGELQYAGGNEYRSRDYRYLGTIGPLRPGCSASEGRFE